MKCAHAILTMREEAFNDQTMPFTIAIQIFSVFPPFMGDCVAY
jgi:uncharacterized protein (UPF0147 family)